jgi:hypothetical protein
VTPDTTKCPRCFKDLVECKQCAKEGKDKRMIAKDQTVCPANHSQVEELAASKSSA